MAKTINLGKVGLTFEDDYDSSKKYSSRTCVFYNHVSWVSKKDVPAGIAPDSNDEYWQKVSERGAQGIQGERGPQGNSAFDGTGIELVNNLTQGGEASALSAEQGKILKEELTELESETLALYEKEILVNPPRISGFMESDGDINTSFAGYYHYIFGVSETQKYIINNFLGGTGTYHVVFRDGEQKIVGLFYNNYDSEKIQNAIVIVPSEAVEMVVNSGSTAPSVSLVTSLIDSSTLKEQIQKTENGLQEVDEEVSIHGQNLQEIESALIEVQTIVNPSRNDGFINPEGILNTTFAGYYHYIFDVTPSQIYIVTNNVGGSGVYHVMFLDENQNIIERVFDNTAETSIKNEKIVAPSGAAEMIINSGVYAPLVQIQKGLINSNELLSIAKNNKSRLDNIGMPNKSMKVVLSDSSFEIRSEFDTERDMIIVYAINNRNDNISPQSAYIGEKSLTNEQIKSLGFCHYTEDSTPPFLLQNYWFIFGEHGYLLAAVKAQHDKTTEDLGSVWRSENGIDFTLIHISENWLYLAPLITQNGGGDGKDTRGFNYGTSFEGAMTHVSGGIHENDIVIETQSTSQWIPITKDVRKKFFVDGQEVSAGEFYCDEFLAIDEHIGVNPLGITNWNPIQGNDLVRLIFSWKFMGLNVFCQHSIRTYYPMWLDYYGAFQPMGLRNWREYSPMIAIPKVKSITNNGVTTDWKYPQNCGTPNQTWASTSFSNTENQLMKVDDMPERIIEFHQSENGYGIGFAAGYSLISGDTINEKRKDLTKTCFQFSQDDRNKLYIRCMDSSKFENQVVPANYVKQFNYYYSYFNPAKSDAMVYYYHEGNKVVVYAHVWDSNEIGIINLSTDFNGKSVSRIVEKTEGIELLTDSVTGNQMMFKSESGANYLVFVLE